MFDTNVFVKQIRSWLDTDAAQFTSMPILVTNEGQARLELFKDQKLIDTVHIYRYSKDELNELLEEMGQVRDTKVSWDSIKSANQFDDMVNNWGAYNEIAVKSDERAKREAEYDEKRRRDKEAEEKMKANDQTHSEEL